MPFRAHRAAAVTLLAIVVACDQSSSPPPSPPEDGAPFLLAAGATRVDPASSEAADWSRGVDARALGFSEPDLVYDLTSPAGAPFTFDLLSRAGDNAGEVRISVLHVADGASRPSGTGSLGRAGVLVSSPGLELGDPIATSGDGFARLTLDGVVETAQIVAFRVDVDGESTTALVRVRPGPESVISRQPRTSDAYPATIETATIYSSPSPLFGLPAVAVSGDRTTVVCYDGHETGGDPRADLLTVDDRYEVRLQYDPSTRAVTGGGEESSSPDRGFWRDHEIAALHNVLAVVEGGYDRVSLALSFDRGATFAQETLLARSDPASSPRLAQIGIALDYSLAVAFWRGTGSGSELVLVEGRPSAFDAGGSPTEFAFDLPRVLHRSIDDASPIIFDVEYSAGGDLVIGYAYSTFRSGGDFVWETLTQSRCATRPFGGEWTDVLIEEARVVSRDPSVALLGSGDSLEIHYAYESREGIRLRTSLDGGQNFSAPFTVGGPNAMMPSVFAREAPDGRTVVDVLYLAGAENGIELHAVRWEDYPLSTPNEVRLTEATFENTGDRLRQTQVAGLGFDATLDGDTIVVAYDEVRWVGLPDIWFADGVPVALPGAVDAAEDSGFRVAGPPPLAPGLTEPVRAPDPEHSHQLRILRLGL